MVKLVIHITKIVIAAAVALLVSSCNMNMASLKKVEGSGTVKTEFRKLSDNITSIEVSNGLEVIVQQDQNAAMKIEADDNLHEHIKTEIENGKLKIYADVNIRNAKAKKVYIKIPKIDAIETSSGASISNSKELEGQNIALSASSGSEMNLKLNYVSVNCDSSSGSEIILSGKADDLKTESSSGSSIDATNLIAKAANSDSSSGSSTDVNVSETLTAEASSGSSVSYQNEPKTIHKKTSSGGSVGKE